MSLADYMVWCRSDGWDRPVPLLHSRYPWWSDRCTDKWAEHYPIAGPSKQEAVDVGCDRQ